MVLIPYMCTVRAAEVVVVVVSVVKAIAEMHFYNATYHISKTNFLGFNHLVF